MRKRGLAPATMAHEQRNVFAWIGWLVQRGELDPDPRRSIPWVIVPEAKQRSVGQEEFIRLLTVASDRPLRPDGEPSKVENRLRNIALLHMLWSTGARRAELAEVDLRDVDLTARTVLLRHTKARRERVVPFDPPAKAALLEYIYSDRGHEPGPLFLSRGGGRLTENAMRLVLQRLSRLAGVQGLGTRFPPRLRRQSAP